MRKKLLVLVKLLVVFACPAQHQFSTSEHPMFPDKADSLLYLSINAQIRRAISNQEYKGNLDSLFVENNKLRSRSTGTRRIYQATPTFTPFDSLMILQNPQAVKYLSVSGRQHRKFPKEILSCTNLEALELVNTRITRVPRKLKNLTQLQSFYVLNNLHSKALKIGSSKTIKVFGIRGESGASLPKSYSGYPNLESLDLAANNLTAFPRGTTHLKKLKTLQLGNNQLALVNDRIGLHANLENLDLVRNKISALPASIQNFPNLRRLTLNNNVIETVDSSIGKLSRLEQLSFYRNNLREVPQGLYQLTALKEIDLYYNQIERIDKQLINWKKLEILYVANNRLIAIPDEIGELHQLAELYLHNNRLSVLPEGLTALQNLRVLRINNNYISQLPEALQHLAKLENLDLSFNQISQLPSSLFESRQLKLLVLVANPFDRDTRDKLPEWAEKLRARQAVVHVDSFAPASDNH